MQEILLNRCYGGFSFSEEAMKEYYTKSKSTTAMLPDYEENQIDYQTLDKGREISRTDPVMIEIVKRLGQKANGSCASIQIACIPQKYTNYHCIDEYDGYESIGILFKDYKFDQIKTTINAYDGTDVAELKQKLEAIISEEEEESQCFKILKENKD